MASSWYPRGVGPQSRPKPVEFKDFALGVGHQLLGDTSSWCYRPLFRLKVFSSNLYQRLRLYVVSPLGRSLLNDGSTSSYKSTVKVDTWGSPRWSHISSPVQEEVRGSCYSIVPQRSRTENGGLRPEELTVLYETRFRGRSDPSDPETVRRDVWLPKETG